MNEAMAGSPLLQLVALLLQVQGTPGLQGKTNWAQS